MNNKADNQQPTKITATSRSVVAVSALVGVVRAVNVTTDATTNATTGFTADFGSLAGFEQPLNPLNLSDGSARQASTKSPTFPVLVMSAIPI
jgi:hypothetical protein